MPLSPKQVRFVAEYLVDLNATQAATRAGYSARTANEQGCRLLANVSVASAVQAGKTKQLASTDLSAARVLEELRRLALIDMRDFYDAAGNYKPVKDLTAEQGACLQSVDVVIKNTKAGDGVTDTVYKIKLWDKPKSLEMLAKHFKLLTEVIQIEDEQGKIATLLAGRQRAAGRGTA